MELAVTPCVSMIKNCNDNNNVTACLVATEECNLGLLIPYTATGMNPYVWLGVQYNLLKLP